MATSGEGEIILVRFQPTPLGGEPHGTFRGSAASSGDGSGGDNTVSMTTKRKLMLLVKGWSLLCGASVEYSMEAMTDEQGFPLNIVSRSMIPIYNADDGIHESVDLVVRPPTEDFTFLQSRIGNTSGRNLTMTCYGYYWEPSLLRELDSVPILRG